MLAYHRHAPTDASGAEEYAMVILNFSSVADTIQVPFPKAGTWTEKLDEDVRPVPWNISVVLPGDLRTILVPSNYGCLFVL